MLKKPQRSDDHYKQALGNSGKKELHFNRKLAPQVVGGKCGQKTPSGRDPEINDNKNKISPSAAASCNFCISYEYINKQKQSCSNFLTVTHTKTLADASGAMWSSMSRPRTL